MIEPTAYTGREQEKRYDPEGEDTRSADTSGTRENEGPREGMLHLGSKVAKATLVFGMVLFVGAFATMLTQTRTGTNTRASNVQYGPSRVSTAEKELTLAYEAYPTAYKGFTIPADLYTEAERQYVALPETNRKSYIINRVMLYYAYDDILTASFNPNYKPLKSPSFAEMEAALPGMRTLVVEGNPNVDSTMIQYLSLFTF